MEALAAVSLAGNVVQFISFASSLVSNTVEIRNSTSGCTDAVMTLETVYGKLSQLSVDLQVASESELSVAPQLSKYVIRIKELSEESKGYCDKLLGVVDKLRNDKGSTTPWQNTKVAFKTLWKAGRISDLEEALRRVQRLLTLEICALTRYDSTVHVGNDRVANQF